MFGDDDTLLETLKLARDLCLATGAFFVAADGNVLSVVSDGEPPELAERVAALALECLSGVDAMLGVPFSRVEESNVARSAANTLACFASPVLDTDGRWCGWIGIVDRWIPELDHAQRSTLDRLAKRFVRATAGTERLDLPGHSVEASDRHSARLPPEPARPVPVELATGLDPEETQVTENLLGQLVSQLPTALLVAKADGTIVLVNSQFAGLCHGEPADILGADISEFLSQVPGDADIGDLDEVLADLPYSGELWRRYVGGGWGATTGTLSEISVPELGQCIVGQFDTQVEAPIEDLRKVSDERSDAILNLLDVGVVLSSSDGTVLVANETAARQHGLRSADEIIGNRLSLVSTVRNAQGERMEWHDHPLFRALQGEVVKDEDIFVGLSSAAALVVSAKQVAIGTESGALLTLRDSENPVLHQGRAINLALYDPLTLIENRQLLGDYLDRTLSDMRTNGGSLGVLLVELEGFKGLDTRFRPEIVDTLLVTVGQRMQATVRSVDMAARLQSDRFILVHRSPAGSVGLESASTRIREALTRPYQIGMHTFRVSTSTVSVHAESGHDTSEGLLERAEKAMLRSKEYGDESGMAEE